MKIKTFFLFLVLVFFSAPALAQDLGIQAITFSKGADGSQQYAVSLQILAIMTGITLLPALLLMMTSFTRIVIVLSILRQALGMPQTPSNQILIGLSLFLSLFIMSPTFNGIYQDAITPYMNEKMDGQKALDKANLYMKNFMIKQTREGDLVTFSKIAKQPYTEEVEKVALTTLIPAFVTSELKTAFQIGFLLFLPFLIIDLVVASVLMSMGMMMVSPMMISLPFKLMLFVLVDGWNLIMVTLTASFGV
jgi:flagellar biosynthetic protein FliP